MIVSKATQEISAKALEIADETFKTWKKVKPEVRADVLFKAAAIIRRRKFEFSALLSKEAGKTWIEADVEVAEGIDFLEYYGREMLRLKDGAPVQSRPGEYNRYNYIPLRCCRCYFTMELPICNYGRYYSCCNGSWEYRVIKTSFYNSNYFL